MEIFSALKEFSLLYGFSLDRLEGTPDKYTASFSIEDHGILLEKNSIGKGYFVQPYLKFWGRYITAPREKSNYSTYIPEPRKTTHAIVRTCKGFLDSLFPKEAVLSVSSFSDFLKSRNFPQSKRLTMESELLRLGPLTEFPGDPFSRVSLTPRHEAIILSFLQKVFWC